VEIFNLFPLWSGVKPEYMESNRPCELVHAVHGKTAQVLNRYRRRVYQKDSGNPVRDRVPEYVR
jgi:hypothetical protein